MYSITFATIAADEYIEAINWYKEKSLDAAEKFVKSINEKLDNISLNPYQYKNLYKKFYEVSTRKYPYTIVYIIEEEKVVIVAVYHHKRRPYKKYRSGLRS
jgi:plasmid stabilization system protein ParE